MQLSNPPIVVVAFNRPKSLRRILSSLIKAYYPENGVILIISIDRGDDNQEVLKIAQEFEWGFGEKTIKYQSENLGLRKHVIECASYCNVYGSVILLEDDLIVSPQFYNYTYQALEYSLEKEHIGGISLYNHQFNVNAKANFSPIEDGYDNWYFQFASSWGQAWTKAQWNAFVDWYSGKTELLLNPSVPKNVTSWSNKSWLKYFIHYLVEANKYFLYPKISLTSNFCDSGTHISQDSTIYQVPLEYSKPKKYVFSDYSDSLATYDVFFENNQLHKTLKINEQSLCVDLYGTKPLDNLKQQYVLSTKIYDFKILKSFGCKMKPIDTNILNDIEGTDIYLYNTAENEKNKNRINISQQILYNIKHLSRRNAKKLFVIMYYQRLVKLVRDNLRL